MFQAIQYCWCLETKQAEKPLSVNAPRILIASTNNELERAGKYRDNVPTKSLGGMKSGFTVKLLLSAMLILMLRSPTPRNSRARAPSSFRWN